MQLHENFLAAKLRKKSLTILEDISHYNLIIHTHLLGQALLKAGYRPDQPRLPAGSRGGGEWTGGAGSTPTFRWRRQRRAATKTGIRSIRRIICCLLIERIYNTRTVRSYL